MNEFLYNIAWWVYTIVTAFMFVMTWGCFMLLINFKDENKHITARYRAILFSVVFFITLIMLSARTPFLNWIGG